MGGRVVETRFQPQEEDYLLDLFEQLDQMSVTSDETSVGEAQGRAPSLSEVTPYTLVPLFPLPSLVIPALVIICPVTAQ